nr:MAG TPA: hypothetical protein [Caudoviricetes sp.]DAQ49273.1 MAG TPA: hypothetical protein [Caudoviricetes sp.]
MQKGASKAPGSAYFTDSIIQPTSCVFQGFLAPMRFCYH